MVNYYERLDGSAPPRQADSMPVPQTPSSRHRTKSCPFCAETIRYGAIKCRFCGEFLNGQRPRSTHTAQAGAEVKPDGSQEDADASGQQDELLWFGRPSIFALTGAAIKTACFTALCWAVYRYPVMLLFTFIPRAKVPLEWLVKIEAWLDLGAFGLGVAAVLALAWRLIALKSIYYEVSPDRIEWSRGIFDRHVDNIDMFRVIDLKLRRSLLDCILGIGTVTLVTKDESDPRFDFVKVRYCRDLYDVLKVAGLTADKKRGVIHLE